MRHSEAKIYIHIYLVELKTTSQVAPMVRTCLSTQAMQEMWVRSLGRGRSPGVGNGNPPQY